MNQLRPFFLLRDSFLHIEMFIHHVRIRSRLAQLQTDTAQIKEYLKIHITGKLTPSIYDPVT